MSGKDDPGHADYPDQPTRLDELRDEQKALVEAAALARGNAHAPYSRFRVGAAGPEISSYSLTVCAERVALFAARAAGADDIVELAVMGPGRGEIPTSPCGACRQVIWDLAPQANVLLATPSGSVAVWSPRNLLPGPFGPDDLDNSD